MLFFQAEDKYTKVVTADGEALIKKPIKELFDELDPEAFWQIHRSTIVSLRAIAKVERDWRDQPVITLKGRPEKLVVVAYVRASVQGDVTGSAFGDRKAARRRHSAHVRDPDCLPRAAT